MTETATVTAGEMVNAKTICLALKIGRFGNSKQASLAGATLSQKNKTKEPDKALLRLTKQLLDSPELVALAKHDSQTAAHVRRLSFNSLFKGGIYLVPISMVEAINDFLDKAIAARHALIDRAVEAYPIRIEETSKRLGVAANEADYPSVERFRASFYMEYSYVSFETPSKLKVISKALFDAETAKQRARLESVAVECQQTMRAGLLKLVEHLKDRLTPKDDGKQKRLHETSISHFNDFLSTFELRNVTDDADLGEIVEKARAIMKGIDHGTLKSDELVRQKMVEELDGLKSVINPLILDKGNRVITFEEDEAEVAAAEDTQA